MNKAIMGLAMVVGLLVSRPAAAVYCDPPGAASIAGIATTTAVNAFTASAISAQTASNLLALQGAAAQISGNVRGALAGQGLIAEAMSNQDTQRLIQGDRVAATLAHQFSTPLCQGATGATVAIAMEAAKAIDDIARSQVNARRSGGFNRPGNGVPASQAPSIDFQKRKPLFCDPNDPVCVGVTGTRPQGDRMPGAILTMGRLQNDTDRQQATLLVQNLTDPVPVPAMTQRQADSAGGRELYMRRGGYETKLNLAKDVVTEIMVGRREATGDANYYNSLAAENGIAQSTGNVSLEDMDRMMYRDRFNAKYRNRIANFGDPTVALREVASLIASQIQEGFRTNQLLEKDVLEMSAMLSTLVEGKLAATTGASN